MRTVGIVAEYNPFHNGHQFQFSYIKEELHADYIVVAMSGDYVQRGTPAILPKHLRAAMALKSGADLILELPVATSTASAEFFAQGSISLLNGIGIIDSICFGSESGDISLFEEFSDILLEEPKEYRTHLKKALSEGKNFPAARAEALLLYLSQKQHSISSEQLKDFLFSPNNILGLEYCKALKKLDSSIPPLTLKREGSGYHELSLEEHSFPSASAIRHAVFSNNTSLENSVSLLLKGQIPDELVADTTAFFEKNIPLSENDLSQILYYCLLCEDTSSLISFLDISEDLARRMINHRNEFLNFQQFTTLLKTRELTQTRIQRALLHLILKIKKAPLTVPYARVLGFRKSSSILLKEIKKNSHIPVFTRLNEASSLLTPEDFAFIEETVFASNLYQNLLTQKNQTPFRHEYEKPVVIL